MNELIKALESLRSEDFPHGECFAGDEPAKYREVTSMAEDKLINNHGGCNWTNIEILAKAGFKVFAAERDSFGWLIGGIRTPYGVVYYG